jgi:hypothetical protein
MSDDDYAAENKILLISHWKRSKKLNRKRDVKLITFLRGERFLPFLPGKLYVSLIRFDVFDQQITFLTFLQSLFSSFATPVCRSAITVST